MSMEWETDKNGRRFRRIGACIEYEPTITIDGVEIPQSEAESFNRRRRAYQEQMNKIPAQETHSCPFQSGLSNRCDHKCALYLGGCALPQLITGAPMADTKGRKCPINRALQMCNESCVLYRNGCILTAIGKEK